MKKIISKDRLTNFFFPKLSILFFIRVLCVAGIAYLVFAYIFVPIRIHGHSMEPTYEDGQFNICFRLTYLFSMPKRYDVVAVRYAGKSVMLLKRIVALEGERVEFRDGTLYVNEEAKAEPYVLHAAKWNLPERTVKKGNVYLVGDNRNVPMEMHDFGQTPIHRIIGAPLW